MAPDSKDDGSIYPPHGEMGTCPMGFVTPPERAQPHPWFALAHAQSNRVPFLLGIIAQMGIRALIDAHVPPHGAWQGARVGTLVSLWLCSILAARDHRLVAVRDWVAARTPTCNAWLTVPLRDTDCTDDRRAKVLTMVGAETPQATLDARLLQQWLRVYRLPTETIRLDRTRVSVYHDPTDDTSLLHAGHSTDHRPDVRQCKALLATLAPLGLPLVCHTVAGNRADDGLSVPAYEAAVQARGTTAVLVVGESTMGAVAPRGHLVAKGSCYRCAYRPPSASEEVATWRAQALARPATWQWLEKVDPKTGEIRAEVRIDAWERAPQWTHPLTQRLHTWTERVRVVRSSASQTGLRRRRERALARLRAEWALLWQPAGRGRKRYRSREALEHTIAERVARAGLTGVVHTTVAEEPLPDGTTRGIVASVGGQWAAWQAVVARLGWQVDVINASPAH